MQEPDPCPFISSCGPLSECHFSASQFSHPCNGDPNVTRNQTVVAMCRLLFFRYGDPQTGGWPGELESSLTEGQRGRGSGGTDGGEAVPPRRGLPGRLSEGRESGSTRLGHQVVLPSRPGFPVATSSHSHGCCLLRGPGTPTLQGSAEPVT